MAFAETLRPPHGRFPWPNLLAPATFLILALLLFLDKLCDPEKILAAKDTDLALQFIPWRKFGFDELRHGHLALWNPHIYGGAPYFAGFQSALLYPPNWVHLLMPVGLAVDWINALHVFLAGMFTHIWCRYRGMGRGASILAGVMFMFCGPYFPHVYAGHLPHIAVMVWAPLLFLAIDMAMDGAFARASLLGAPVMALFVLAGHPQYVYYTGMAAAVYVMVNLWRAKKIPTALAACAIIVIGGVAIAAVQLLSGMDFVNESVRSSGTKYQFSASFSFPPENLLTMLAPNVFGHLSASAGQQVPDTYFGRCYFWEVSLFLSVTGLLLAIVGMIATRLAQRRGAITMVVVCFILALGAHTPLHHFLYDHLPGFSGFRGSTKFAYLVALFMSLLAGYGFDTLLASRRAIWIAIGVAAALLVSVVIFALCIDASAHAGLSGNWARAVRGILETALDQNDLMSNPLWLGEPSLLERAGEITSSALFGCAVILAICLTILALTRFWPRMVYALLLLAMFELICFGASNRATMDATPDMPKAWVDAVKSVPADARVLDSTATRSNFGMWFGYDDIWGYDPGVLKRYAELIARSQGMNPDDASQYVQFRRPDPQIFPLLRCAGVLTGDEKRPLIAMPKPMSLVQLVPMAYVLKDRDQILSTIESTSFNPRQAVLLESAPSIKPAGNFDPGIVKIVDQTSDRLDVEADVTANAMLLVTNAYSKGWRIESLGPSSQSSYEIMPADWALQAIPLSPGKHYLRLEYRPSAFVIGKWISILALLAYTAALTRYVWPRLWKSG